MAYRILKYPWHTGHDYELAKLPHRFLYLSDTYRRWALSQRPVPESVEWVSSSESPETDVKMLHLDQWSYQEPSKRFFFLNQKENYAGPKVVIIHGANTHDGMSSKKMRELVDGCHVVCNSPTALEHWDLPQSRFILHGFSPQEWPESTHELQNIVVTQDYSKRHAVVRNLDGVIQAEEKVALTWIGRDVKFSSFDRYRNFLSNSSVFFNPSFASANPRARAEAMLCGLAIVTTNSHGESDYIENDVNGFCSNNFDELIDYLQYLNAHPERAREIGRKGRETAQQKFHIERFSKEWDDLLDEVVTG